MKPMTAEEAVLQMEMLGDPKQEMLEGYTTMAYLAARTTKIMAKAIFLQAGCAIIGVTPINESDQDTCQHLNSV